MISRQPSTGRNKVLFSGLSGPRPRRSGLCRCLWGRIGKENRQGGRFSKPIPNRIFLQNKFGFYHRTIRINERNIVTGTTPTKKPEKTTRPTFFHSTSILRQLLLCSYSFFAAFFPDSIFFRCSCCGPWFSAVDHGSLHAVDHDSLHARGGP